MSNLVDYAKSELDIAGLTADGDEYDVAVREAALEIIEKFSDQGHSGFSAGMVTNIVEKLMRFHPLTPLTGDDDEWTEVTEGVFQNKRCSHVFKENGRAYDINGRVFEEPNGCRFTSRDSRVEVTFPYEPKTEVVQRDAS
jgi:hypothetical protein